MQTAGRKEGRKEERKKERKEGRKEGRVGNSRAEAGRGPVWKKRGKGDGIVETRGFSERGRKRGRGAPGYRREGCASGLISTEDCACVEKGASAIARSFRESRRRPPRRKRKSPPRSPSSVDRRVDEKQAATTTVRGRLPVFSWQSRQRPGARHGDSNARTGPHFRKRPARARSRGELDSAWRRVARIVVVVVGVRGKTSAGGPWRRGGTGRGISGR